jgi:AcrB/AcrD/AcrF family
MSGRVSVQRVIRPKPPSPPTKFLGYCLYTPYTRPMLSRSPYTILSPHSVKARDGRTLAPRRRGHQHHPRVARRTLIEEAIVVSLVILVFLFQFRSALVPILALPIAVVGSFIPMYYLDVNSNIMSLGGLALAIGVLVDASIVMVENAYARARASLSTPRRVP